MKNYYHINEIIFFMIDQDNKCYIELFSIESQKRIMKINDIKLFDDLITRLSSQELVGISEESFNTKLLEVKDSIV